MIGFLRLIGVINAAVWLGAAVFHTVSAGPAASSTDMLAALQKPQNFSYFSSAIEQVLLSRYFHFLIFCAVIALIHLLAEWLYLGRPARKLSFTLLGILLGLALVGGNGLQPRLERLHNIRDRNPQSAAGQEAARSFRTSHTVLELLNALMIGGLVVHLWRVTNPSDTPRFISSVKFRG